MVRSDHIASASIPLHMLHCYSADRFDFAASNIGYIRTKKTYSFVVGKARWADVNEHMSKRLRKDSKSNLENDK